MILPGGAILFRQNVARELAFIEEAQWWDPDRIRELQQERLQRLIKVAYEEVPFYRSLFVRAGLTWEDVRSLDDLALLPVVTKSMLRSEYPAGTTRKTAFPTYEVRSSGSTGANFCVQEDSETAANYRAFFMLALGWAGWRIGEPHMQTGMTLDRSLDRRLKDFFFRCSYVSAFDLSNTNLDTALDTLERKSIRFLWGYPGSLYYLARRAAERGWSRPLVSAVTWGDNLYPHYRSMIESVFQTKVFDTYGCGEGIQIAAQCGYRSHYHVNSLNVIVELLGGDGKPVERGQAGHVVLTRLHPGPMPLIRYAVGDIAIRGASASCPCGRHLELLDCIEGRDTDVVFTPSGNRLIVHFFTGILEHFSEVREFQVVQPDHDSIVVRVVVTDPAASHRELPERISAAFRAKGLTDLSVAVHRVAEIPPAASGKRRFVISHLPRRFA